MPGPAAGQTLACRARVTRNRAAVLVVVLTLVGCRERALDASLAGLKVPTELELPDTVVGARGEGALTVTNTGQVPLTVSATTGAPFEVTPSVEVEAGASVDLAVVFHPDALGEVRGTVSLAWSDATAEVTVWAQGVRAPSCSPPPDCRTTRYDVGTNRCVIEPAADGTACGANDRCLTGGQCLSGVCRGQPVRCDDQNACTLDSCSAATGCQHTSQADRCPGDDNPCHAAFCDPATGCGLTDVADGTSCGANDCTTAQVCIAGACVARPSPEGSVCAPATACQDEGICRSSTCVRPAAGQPKLLWTHGSQHAAPDGQDPISFRGQLDSLGNSYFAEYGNPDQRHVNGVIMKLDPPAGEEGSGAKPGAAFECLGDSVCRGGVIPGEPCVCSERQLVSLDAKGRERFRKPVGHQCERCVVGMTIDEAAGQLVLVGGDFVAAYGLADGRERWSTALLTNLPVHQPKPDGGASFAPSPAMVLGGGRVGVPVSEGVDDHHVSVRVLDGANGYLRWTVERKGHAYGQGVLDGELWQTTANCWAPAGQLERVSGTDGGVLASQFLSLLPLAYGESTAVASLSSSGAMVLLDKAFGQRVVPQSRSSDRVLAAPGRLVWWDQSVIDSQQNALRELDPLTLATRWRFAMVERPTSLELLASGEVLAQNTQLGTLTGIRRDGTVSLECTLPLGITTPLAVSNGVMVVKVGQQVRGYALPGAQVAPKGWVADEGSLGRGRAPR